MKRATTTIAILLGLAVVVFLIGNKTVSQENPYASIPRQVGSGTKKPKISLPKFILEMPSKFEVDDLTSRIIGNSNDSIHQRNSLVSELKNRELKETDFQALFTFLVQKPLEEGPQLEWHSLKNDLLVFMIDDGRFKETTGQLMIDIINDPQQHEVMREYTLQYIPDYFQKHWLLVKGSEKKENPHLSDLDVDLQDQFIDTMFKMLDERKGPISGTALIGLHELSDTFSRIDSDVLEKAVEKMVIDPSVPVSSRMAALSVATERKMGNLSKLVQEITFDEGASISLRMSALHTASTMEPAQGFYQELKNKFINKTPVDRRLKNAALEAIKTFESDKG